MEFRACRTSAVTSVTELNHKTVLILTYFYATYIYQSVFWGEEREDGAVYAVTLKKVRYRSSDLKLFTDDEEISHLQWKTLKIRKIKNGTLPKLVEHLAPCKATLDEIDPGYLVAFLTTYRSFAKPQDVLNLLLER